MPSGGLVASHNRNQCITRTLGCRKFTVNSPSVPTDQAHDHPRQVDPAYQKIRRPDSGPKRPIWCPTRLPKDLAEDSKRPYPERPQDLACKTRKWCIPTKQINEYGKCCNQLDLGLLVVTDQESWNRPCPMANIKRAGRPLVITQSSSNLHQQLGIGFYSPEARTSINSLCPLCFVCLCTTFEFLALDSTLLNK
jgi:hypothetical protein